MTAEEIRSELERLDVPHGDAVAWYDVRLGEGIPDEPTVWVYVVIRDDRIDGIWEDRERLRQVIDDHLMELVGNEYFPLVTFRTVSEVEALRAEAR